MNGLIQVFGNFINKNNIQILTGIAISGVLGTSISAVYSTPKALRLLEEVGGKNWKQKLTKREILSLVWKLYLPAAGIGTLTIVSILGGTKISQKKYAALAAVYSLTENSLKLYQNKVVEILGEKKHKEIQGKVGYEKMKDNQSAKDAIILTGKGEYLCYDSLSGRYFRSNIEAIRKTINNFNERLLRESFLSLNEFYYDLGLDSVNLGSDVGWSIHEEGMVDVGYSTHLSKDDEPCLVLDYLVKPKGWER